MTMEDSKLTPKIVILRKGKGSRTIPLDRPYLRIGRSSDCGIVLPGPSVSREHAWIERRPDGYYLEDLDSHSGTLVDGRPLATRSPLRMVDGQKYQICDYTLIFQDPMVQIQDEEKDDSAICETIDVASSSLDKKFLTVRPEEKLRAILEVSKSLGTTLDLGEILDKTLQALFRIFPQADRGFVLLKDKDGPNAELRLHAFRSRRHAPEPCSMSQTVLDQVLGRGLAIHCDDTKTDLRFRKAKSVSDEGIRTMLCAPILDQQHPVGLLQLDSQDPQNQFRGDDLDVLVAVVGQLSVVRRAALLHKSQVVHEKYETELRYARQMQRSLLPAGPPEVLGHEFWGRYEPARHVGGDYFGFFPVASPEDRPGQPPGRWAVVVGDVSGKGMPAALLMAKLSAEVSGALAAETDPGRAVAHLNRRFCEAELPGEFVTFLLIILEAETGQLRIVRAGHCPPIIRRSTGQIETVGEEPSGPPLGVRPGQAYEVSEAIIHPGDVVVLYTDGISEAVAPGGQQFGVEQLNKAIAAAPAEAAELGEAILRAVEQHAAGAPQSDDIALVCFGKIADKRSKTPQP